MGLALAQGLDPDQELGPVLAGHLLELSALEAACVERLAHLVGGQHAAETDLEQRAAREVHAVLRPAVREEPHRSCGRDRTREEVREAAVPHEREIGADQELEHGTRLEWVRC